MKTQTQINDPSNANSGNVPKVQQINIPIEDRNHHRSENFKCHN